MIDISVIIPAYNIADFIGEALDSVIRQDPPFAQIIVIDDGSTDGTGDIVQAYDDKRIQYHYQDNQGLSAARNKGIQLCASGEYLYFMDGDDILMDGFTSFFYREIEKAEVLPDAIFFSAIDFDQRTGATLPSSKYFRWRTPGVYSHGEAALLAALRSGHFPASAVIYIFSRKILSQNVQLRFLNFVHEDEIFTPDLLLHCETTVVSNTVLYKRRVRTDSIMSTPASVRNVIGSLVAARRWSERAKIADEQSVNIFQLQAHRLYGTAIRYATRAGIDLMTVKSLVRKEMPEFKRFTTFDYFLSRLSRRIGDDFCNARAKLMVRSRVR